MSRFENSRAESAPDLAALTLDFTHTLAHCPRVGQIYAEVLGKHGIDLPRSEIEEHLLLVWQELSFSAGPERDRFSFHGGTQPFWHRFVSRLCSYLGEVQPSRFATAELVACFGRADAWSLYDDVVPVLRAARKHGWRIGLVSNWDDRLPGLIADLGIAPFFDSIVHSQALGREKPHPELFSSCLRELEVEAAAALHVGNHPVEDVEGAIAIGMRALRIDRQADETLIDLLVPWLGPIDLRDAGTADP